MKQDDIQGHLFMCKLVYLSGSFSVGKRWVRSVYVCVFLALLCLWLSKNRAKALLISVEYYEQLCTTKSLRCCVVSSV